MSNIKTNLGKSIQKFRKKRGLTQEKLAERIGIETSNLSKIETGRNYPTSETLEKILQCLDISAQTLFTFEKNFKNADYIKAIHKNINNFKNNEQKLKFLYNLTLNL